MQISARLASILAGGALLVGYGGYRIGTSKTGPAETPITPANAPAARAPGIRYERWRDPRERAFTIEVPAGWRTEGGVFRHGPVDVRSTWTTTSPDGAIYVSGGDAEIPPFTVPNQMLSFGGFREGSWYAPPQGSGTRLMVRQYLPGAAFARDHVTSKIARTCSNVVVTESGERPDAVSALNAATSEFGNVGLDVRLSAGEVGFTCNRGGTALEGYYFAATQLVQNEIMAMWTVPHLYGFLAPPDRAAQAQAVLEHVLGSFELSQDWSARQQAGTMRTSADVRRANDAVTEILRRSWERRNADGGAPPE